MVIECIKKRGREWGPGREGKWATTKRELLETEGFTREEMERWRGRDENVAQKIEEERCTRDRVERSERIRQSQ